MRFCNGKVFTTILLVLAFSAPRLRAADEGQKDLDKATEAKLSATTLTDLGEVIRLTESALQKGLDQSNTEFANKLLASTLVQRATAVAVTMQKNFPADRRWPNYRQFALLDLEKSIKLNPKQPQALILIAQLNLLPDGDEKRAKEAVDQAVELAADDSKVRAKALVLRSEMEKKLQNRLPDLNEAVRLSPEDPNIRRVRGAVLAGLERFDDALSDFDKAIELNPEFVGNYELKSVVLARMNRFDEALSVLDQERKFAPNSIAPLLRKRQIHLSQKKLDDALDDMNKALALDPGNTDLFLLRSSIYLEKGDKQSALADAEKVVQLAPKNPGAIQAYAAILAEIGKLDEALVQAEKARKLDPDNPATALQAGLIFVRQKRSSKAIDIYSEFLKDHPDSPTILYARGDACLNVGKQAEAVADYEKAYKDKDLSKDSGLLNNFAWALATSSDEKLRDGRRAVKMALMACETTEYRQAHILSTLAAAYAETGDFDNAIKWSTKSGEIGSKEHAEDFKKELETYKAHKPYREALSEKEEEKTQEAPTASRETATTPEQKPPQPDDAAPKADEKTANPPEPTTEIIAPFNGKKLDGWTLKQPRNRSKWTVGAAQVDPQNPQGLIISFPGERPGELINRDTHGVDIYTDSKFGDCTIELEFMIPKGSNSGVYVMGEYEIQIFDSFEKKVVTWNDLGAIYEAAIPTVNAAKAPGEWQSLTVEFQAPRFANGEKIAAARFAKMTLNGQVIHENVEMKGPTPGGLTGKEAPQGPLMFQGDHGPVAFRNIKITLPADKKK
jgi:tetratricopeptide (TPR) repeat protein